MERERSLNKIQKNFSNKTYNLNKKHFIYKDFCNNGTKFEYHLDKINGDYYKVYHNGKNFNVKLVDGKLLERIKIFNIYRYYDIVPKIVQTNFTDFTNFTNIQQKNYSIFNFFSDNR